MSNDKPSRRHEAWRVHCHKDLVIKLTEICEQLGMPRRQFMDELVKFGIHAATTSCGRVSVLEMLQEAARKDYADE